MNIMPPIYEHWSLSSRLFCLQVSAITNTLCLAASACLNNNWIFKNVWPPNILPVSLAMTIVQAQCVEKTTRECFASPSDLSTSLSKGKLPKNSGKTKKKRRFSSGCQWTISIKPLDSRLSQAGAWEWFVAWFPKTILKVNLRLGFTA